MSATGERCLQSGKWMGLCKHPATTVWKGDKFPICETCKRGISWKMVESLSEKDKPKRNPGW